MSALWPVAEKQHVGSIRHPIKLTQKEETTYCVLLEVPITDSFNCHAGIAGSIALFA